MVVNDSVTREAITPHVCRYTYCSNMARSGMNPKTFQYLMDCRVTACCVSCEIGNKLTEDQQWAKLSLVKEIAEEVWGAQETI